MCSLGIQRGGGFVGQQDRGMFKQRTGNGDALLFTARKFAASLTAQGIEPAPGDEFLQVRAADDLIYRFVRESAEHRDIIPDGRIKHKDILLHNGDKVIQRFRRKGADVDTIKKYLPVSA